MRERQKEKEVDSRDRSKEKEELEEIRRKLQEEGHPDLEGEMAKVTMLLSSSDVCSALDHNE